MTFFYLLTDPLSSQLLFFLKSSAEQETSNITKNLNSENFFNLSKHRVNPQLSQKLTLGRKFTPYLKVIVGKELKNFDSEVYDCISRFIWGFSKPCTSKNVKSLLKKLLHSEKVKKDKLKSSVLSSILVSYKRTRKLFFTHLHTNINHLNLEDNFSFQSHFLLHPDQIVIAANKNVGFVCMDPRGLLFSIRKD